MTTGQAEAMDIISHMSAKEIKELAELIVKELEIKLKAEANSRLIDTLKLERTLGRKKARLAVIRTGQ